MALAAGAGGAARAADCGGAVPCECGDRVIADVVLTKDLGPCPGHGLTIASGVTVDAAGHAIRGSGARESYGLYFRDAEEAAVVDAVVSGFARGVRFRHARDCRVEASEIYANGDAAKHRGYGIEVAAGSEGNAIVANAIHDNADEGVHLGAGSRETELRGNLIYDDFRENVYLLESEENSILENEIAGGRNSLYVKHSSRNRIERNLLGDAPLLLRGDSRDNELVANDLVGAGLHFQIYAEQRPALAPSDNRVRGGTIADARICLGFRSASGNEVRGTALSGCEIAIRSESDDARAANALVDVAFDPARVELDRGSRLLVTDDGRTRVWGEAPTRSASPLERDLAIARIRAPRRVRLGRSGERKVRVRVALENRGASPERIESAEAMAALLHLDVLAEAACPAPVPLLAERPRRYPIEIAPGESAVVAFEIAFRCDAAPEGERARFRYRAALDPDALAAGPDANPGDDLCPRPSRAGDPGCGGRTRAGRRRGQEIETAVIR